MLHYRFNLTAGKSGYNRVDCSVEFWRFDCSVEFWRRRGDPSSVSCEGVDPLEDGLAPADTMFLNQAPWKVGLPLLWLLPGDSGEAWFFEARPAINLYATLLAFTISVLACLNCKTQIHNQKKIILSKVIQDVTYCQTFKEWSLHRDV
jgi:hypothetical protein